MAIVALLLTGFTGCKSADSQNDSAIADGYVAGDENIPSGDKPTVVPNQNNKPDASDKNEQSNVGQNDAEQNNEGNGEQNGEQNNNQNNNTNKDDQDDSSNDQPNENRPGSDQNDEPAADDPVEDQPVEDEPADDTPVEDKPSDEEPGGYGEDEDFEDEENEESGSGNESASDRPPFSKSKALKIVSFNIKHCGTAGITAVAELLKQVDGDIVGLQEVDCNATRSGNKDQMKILAELAGYKYYYFAPVIQLGGNKTKPAPANLNKQAYGHGILSKYPIKESQIIWPSAQSATGEIRNYERHKIDVNGKIVTFYNTHSDFEKGRLQYAEVQDKYMSKDKYAICVGDLNETMDEFGSYFNDDKFYNFGFGENMNSPILRDKGGKKAQVIDHIIVTKDTMVWYDEMVQNGYYIVPHGGASDHNLIYAYINLLD